MIRGCQDLPGQRLFQYLDEDGQRHAVELADVNAYLHDAVGEELLRQGLPHLGRHPAGRPLLAACERAESQAQHKHVVADCVKRVASRLGNTPAVCRTSYIHPEVIAAYADDRLKAGFRRCPGASADLREGDAALPAPAPRGACRPRNRPYRTALRLSHSSHATEGADHGQTCRPSRRFRPLGPPCGRRARLHASGELIPPADYRNWVFLTSSLDMNYQAGQAAPKTHMLDNVFVDPASWAEFDARSGGHATRRRSSGARATR